MERETVRNAVLALFGVVAVTLTAATLPSAFRPRRGGSGGSGGAGAGDGAGRPSSPFSAGSAEPVVEIPFLTELAAAVALLLVLVALRYLYRNRRRAFRGAVLLLAFALVGALVARFFATNPSMASAPVFPPMPSNASGGGGASGEPVSDPPVLALALVLVMAAAVLGATVAVRNRSAGSEAPPPDDEPGSAAAAAVGRAAGRAADRIEEGDDLDNEVYRAWREMTALLDVRRPETTTAGEFETAAVEAGMDPGDVRELTDLFESIRYGGHEPEPADERRAVELLRRIEDRYAGADE